MIDSTENRAAAILACSRLLQMLSTLFYGQWLTAQSGLRAAWERSLSTPNVLHIPCEVPRNMATIIPAEAGPGFAPQAVWWAQGFYSVPVPMGPGWPFVWSSRWTDFPASCLQRIALDVLGFAQQAQALGLDGLPDLRPEVWGLG